MKSWEEAVKNLETVQKMDIRNNTNFNRIIQIYTMLSEVFLNLGHLEQSHKSINDGEKVLHGLYYQDGDELVKHGFGTKTLDKLESIQVDFDILRTKLYLQRGLTLEMEGRVKECA